MNQTKMVIWKLAWIAIILILVFSTNLAARSSPLSPAADESRVYLPYIRKMDAWAQVDPTGQSVVFWHIHSGDREVALQEIVDEFNTTNPWDITVTLMNQGTYSDIYDKMLLAIATGETPDLVVAYQYQAAAYQLSDALLDMTSLLESSRWGLTEADIADIFPGMYEQDIFSYFNNARLGFPPNRSMEVLYYNLDWIMELGYTAPPATPDEFRAMACAAVENPFSAGSGGESMGYLLSPNASRFASWTFAFGGEIFDKETNLYTFNSVEAVAAMTFLQGLFNDGCADFVMDSFEDIFGFGQGDLLFSITSSAGIPYYREQVESGAQFDWNVGAISHVTDDPVMDIYGASISMPKHTPEREVAAWLFLKYFTSTEVQADWVRASGYLPVRQSTAGELGTYFAANPQFATAFELLPYTKAEPNTLNYDPVRDLVVTAMIEIMEGSDVLTTLNELNTNANATLP
jgi:multiple sugar transport system substrate-binding protein